jgi:hypothetical protein
MSTTAEIFVAGRSLVDITTVTADRFSHLCQTVCRPFPIFHLTFSDFFWLTESGQFFMLDEC